MNRCLGILVLVLLSQPVAAQVIVRETVSNESGRPLEQSQVTLDPQGANRQMRTNAEGQFSSSAFRRVSTWSVCSAWDSLPRLGRWTSPT